MEGMTIYGVAGGILIGVSGYIKNMKNEKLQIEKILSVAVIGGCVGLFFDLSKLDKEETVQLILALSSVGGLSLGIKNVIKGSMRYLGWWKDEHRKGQ